MSASGLAAVSALQQIQLGEDVEPVLDVVIDILHEALARRGLD
jgi:hypothetical protein